MYSPANTTAPAAAVPETKPPCPRTRTGGADQLQWVQQRHAFFTVAASAIGAGILLNKKGTKPHRIMGRVWTGVAVLTSLNSFRLRDAQGNFTWFHGLSVLTLSSAAAGIYFARAKKITKHKQFMGVAYATAIMAGALAYATPGKTTTFDGAAWRNSAVAPAKA